MTPSLPSSTGFVAVWVFSLWGLLLPVGGAFGQVLDSQKLVESQSFWNGRDWSWYKKNIPFFECPGAEINATCHYRWESLGKHLTYGSPHSGYSFPELIGRYYWSSAYGAICRPAGQQLYEATDPVHLAESPKLPVDASKPKPAADTPKSNGPIEAPLSPVKNASADWSAYKGDVARSSVTSATTPLPLKILWSYDSGQSPRPAWSEPGRALNMLDFDYCYQPIAAAGLVCFASSADDAVRALKADTGELVWSFITGGPVRFAPQILGEKCYFASDDGHAYCVEARTGKEIWRYRAALNDRQLLANGRMTSRWPCRSGVLVHDGVLYVTAGMWPSEGVYLHALDAATGRPIWCNDTSCYDYVEYPHAPSVSFGGPAPQGYLLFGKQTLVVPTGRCAPAAFDAKTGKLLHFWANSPNRGGTWATLAGDHIFVSAIAWQPDQPVRLGESVPHRADSIAALALRSGKEEWPWDKAVMEFTDELKLPRWRSQVGHGIFSRQRVIFQGKRFYALGNGKADAFEITGEKTVKRLWSVSCPRVYSEALTGNALLIGSQDKLVALNPETGATLSEVPVPGQIRGLAVAGGRVIASTEQGRIFALGDGPKVVLKPASPSKNAAPVDASIQDHASALGGKGFAVVVSASDARSAQRLAESTQMHVLCLLPGREIVEKERRRLLVDSTHYGSRIAVLSTDSKTLPMISHFANLVIVSGKIDALASSELYRVLRPCGGRMLFHDGADGAAIAREAGIPLEEVKKAEGMFVLRGPLPGSFDWNSKVQADERVRWPLEFQWFGEPSGQLLVSRHAKPRTPIPAHGRLFIFGESHLTALDAYNGAELWRRRLSVGVCTGQQAVSADDQHLYVQDGSVTWQFDAQTGKLVKAFGKKAEPSVHSLQKPLELTASGKKGETGTLRIVEDPDGIQISLTTQSNAPTRDDRWELAFDFRSAGQRLNAPAKGAFELIVDPWKGAYIPHQTHPHPAVTIKTLDASKEGVRTVVLTIPREPFERWLGQELTDFAIAADVKLWTDDFRLLLWGKPMAAGSGKRAWPNEAEAVVHLSSAAAKFSVPFGSLNELPEVASKPGRLPPMTRSRPDGDYSADFKEGIGKENTKGKLTMLQRVLGFEAEKRKHPLTGADVSRDYSRSYGCSGASCSAAMDFFRSGTIGMIDRLEDSGMRNISGIRSGCGQTLIPAFGLLLYSESTSDCLCSYSFATSLAMAPAASQRHEDWALFDDKQLAAGLVRKSALNLGAPGDRRDKDGALWLGFPRPALGVAKKTAWQVPYSFDSAPGFGPYRINTDRQSILNTDRSWIYGSGIKGLSQLKLDLVHHQPSKVLLSLSPGKAPTLDGELNDACWDGFGALPLTERNANVYFRQDGDNVYVAFEQKAHVDRLGKKLPWKASVKGKDGAFERDDHLRLSFFNPKGTRVVTLAVTAGGGTYDALLDLGKDGSLKEKRMPIPPEDSAWNGIWQAKTSRSAEAFRAEIVLPWKTLEDAGLQRETLSVECLRKTRWGGAKDANLLRLVENGVEIHSIEKPTPRRFAVRLHFAELEDIGPGERVFDVLMQGRMVLKDFDVVQKAGGRFRALVVELRNIEADRQIDLRFIPRMGTLTDQNAPILSGIEVLQQ